MTRQQTRDPIGTMASPSYWLPFPPTVLR